MVHLVNHPLKEPLSSLDRLHTSSVQAVQQVLRLEQRYWLSEVDLQQALAGVGRFTPSGVAASGPASARASHGHANDALELQ